MYFWCERAAVVGSWSSDSKSLSVFSVVSRVAANGSWSFLRLERDRLVSQLRVVELDGDVRAVIDAENPAGAPAFAAGDAPCLVDAVAGHDLFDRRGQPHDRWHDRAGLARHCG